MAFVVAEFNCTFYSFFFFKQIIAPKHVKEKAKTSEDPLRDFADDWENNRSEKRELLHEFLFARKTDTADDTNVP